jgi:hypothetical protein
VSRSQARKIREPVIINALGVVRSPVSPSPLILRPHMADLRHLALQIRAYAFAFLEFLVVS